MRCGCRVQAAGEGLHGFVLVKKEVHDASVDEEEK